jgi:TonB family protein
MRKSLVPVLVAAATLLFASGAAAQDQAGREQPTAALAPVEANWVRYIYPGEEFSVELPAAPFVWETMRPVRSSIFETEKMRVFGAYADGVVYLVASFHKPRSSESLDYFLTILSSGSNYRTKGEMKSGESPGRAYLGTNNPGEEVRLFRTKNRVYLFKAFAEEADSPAALRFLDSVALLATPTGRAARPLEYLAAPPAVTASAKAQPPQPAAGDGGGRGAGAEVPPSAAPAASVDRPFPSAETTRKARIVYRPEPHYTEEARRNHVTGVVRLRAVLSSSGKVTNISVLKTLPDGLTEQAIHSARHILFLPARKDGRRVSQWVVIEYNFHIY